jgi:PAS domain S-box-containing protein
MDRTIVQLILQDRKIAYFIVDRNLIVTEVSGSLSMCGIAHETCLGRSLFELLPELIGSEGVLADILAGSLPRFQLPWVNRETAEGEAVYLTMVDLPYKDRSGQITGLIHVVHNVTEMGRLEQQVTQHRNELRLLRDQLAKQNLKLAATNAELRHLDQIKSEFVSVAAHELRTPLSSIMGYIEILLDEDFDPLTDQQRDFLQVVERGAHRLLSITNNLLDVTRIETGRIELWLEPTDLPALIESVASEFSLQLEAKAQRLTLRAVPGLPPALCDQVRAAQIIGNLLSNANKYTPEGGLIVVSVTQAEEQGFLQISVADDGVGISPEDQERLFDRFFRAESARLTRATGAGLGLHITHSLVEQHGGRIWFESELDQGSTFYVTFPMADIPDDS